MTRITALYVLVVAMLPLCSVITVADESLMSQYVSTFEGRWVCEAPTAQDIEGYWKKGDVVRSEAVYTSQPDRSGMRYEVSFSREEKALRGLTGISTWDAAKNVIKEYGFAPPGFRVDVTVSKAEANMWISESQLTHPDGAVSSSKLAITISDDGKTQTRVLVEGVDKNGKRLEQSTRVWSKMSKNQEVLEKELSWIIGTWDCKIDVPGLGTVPIEAKYNWVADNHIIQADMTFGEWKGLSIIFYDPSDGRIKMWGANSGGGNGQAVLEIVGDELVWTNTVFEGDGRKRVSDFSYIKQSGHETFVVKYVDEVDNAQKQVTVTKRN